MPPFACIPPKQIDEANDEVKTKLKQLNLHHALEAYEKEILRLRRNLYRTSGKYMEAILATYHASDKVIDAEDAECIATLKRDMQIWDVESRGRKRPTYVPHLASRK